MEHRSIRASLARVAQPVVGHGLSRRPSLDSLAHKWLNELELFGWKVDISYKENLTDRHGAPVYGLCSAIADNRTAIIFIRDPNTPVSANDPGVEEIVIHEIAHLHFAPFNFNTNGEVTLEEHAVWGFAGALARASSKDRTMLVKAMRARCMSTLQAFRRLPQSHTPRFFLCGDTGTMNIIDLIKALEDAKAANDWEAIVALITQLQAANTADTAEAEAAALEEKQKEMTRRSVASSNAAATGISAATLRAAMLPVLSPLMQKLDAVEKNDLMREHGHKMSAKQQRYARSLNASALAAFVATIEDDGADGQAGTNNGSHGPGFTMRNAAPARGARGVGALSEVDTLVDRAMGVQQHAEQTISIDQYGRLQIGHTTKPIKYMGRSGG